MFNPNFYPTKKEVVLKMIGINDLSGKVVFEPHGGSGNIIDVLKDFDIKEVLACEIHPDLAKITESKSDRFIKNDFFEVTSEEISHVDFIIANPPFSNDAKHILHMWNICPGGCTILTLCNFETLRNSYSNERIRLKELVTDHGLYENYGSCFDDAERKTNVEVGFITLFKPRKQGDMEFDGYFDMEEEAWTQGEGITRYNSIQEIVNRVVSAVKMFNETMDTANKINDVMGEISGGLVFGAFHRKGYNEIVSVDRDTFKKELQKAAWLHVFSKMNMDKYVTRSVKETLNKFVEQQEKTPFTMKNVFKMIEMVLGTNQERMDGMLVEAFDKICSYAHGNSTAGEKWKTNSNYKVNKTFIHNWVTNYDNRWPTEHVDLRYEAAEYFDDIVKAMCYLTGTNYDISTGLRQFVHGTNGRWLEWGRWYQWGFFEIKGFKKGTMHFKFSDDKVWELFNRRVAELKGWQLPQKTDKKTKGTERTVHTEMTLF